MPPINLYCLPSQDWFDKLQARPHSRETLNRQPIKAVERKQPREFMRSR